MTKIKSVVCILICTLIPSFAFSAIQPHEIIKDVPFTLNKKGTVIFENITDMFEQMNNISVDGGTLEIIKQSPPNIKVHPIIFENEAPDVIDFMIGYELFNAIYDTFTYTKENKITVESIPKIFSSYIAIPELAISATVTREFALEVLQHYTPVESFDDLVQFKSKNKYTMIGYENSDLRNEVVHADKANFAKIIKALVTGKL